MRWQPSPILRASFGVVIAVGAAASAAAQEGTPAQPAPAQSGPEITLEIQGDVTVPAEAGGFFLPTAPVRIVASADGGGMFFAQPFDEEPTSMLHLPNVERELEVMEDQKAKIRQIHQTMHQDVGKAFAELHLPAPRPGDREEADRRAAKHEEIQKRVKEIRVEAARQVDDVLLPHQRKRLQEIAMRHRLRQRGTAGALADTDLAKTLDISSEQKERLKKRSAEVQEELEQKIAKLREEAREEILDELTPAQRSKLKALLGAEFDDRPAPRRIERKTIERKTIERKTTEPGRGE